MELLGYLVLGGIALFFIVLIAVKITFKEALYEIKEEIIKEFDLKKVKINEK